MAYRQLAYLPDRRSTRLERPVQVNVGGLDAADMPYLEETSTVSISCHGCSYLSRNNVPLGGIALLQAYSPQSEPSAASVHALIRSVRPLAEKKLFEVAVEFELPQDIWGLARSPEDWADFAKTNLPGKSNRELKIVARSPVPKFSETKPLSKEPAGPFQATGIREESSLPPLLAHIAATIRADALIGLDRTAAPAVNAKPKTTGAASIQEFCSHIELKATELLQSLVGTLAEELDGRLGMTGDARRMTRFRCR